MVSLLDMVSLAVFTFTLLTAAWSRPVQRSVKCKSIPAKCVSEQYPTKCNGFKVCWSHGHKQRMIYCESEPFVGHSARIYIDYQCMNAMSDNDNDNMDFGDSHNPSPNDHGRYDRVDNSTVNSNVDIQDMNDNNNVPDTDNNNVPDTDNSNVNSNVDTQDIKDNNNVPDTDNNDDVSENDTHRRDSTEGPNETINEPTKREENGKNQTREQKSAATQACVDIVLVTIFPLLAMITTGYS